MADVLLPAAGAWLNSLGIVQDIQWSSQWGPGPCGPSLASCSLAVDPANDSSVLRMSQDFAIHDAGVPVFGGEMTEPERGFPWSLSAAGYARRAADFLALDGFGAPTTNPQEAVTQAIASGLPWSNPNAFDNVPFGDAPVTPQSLDTLLDNWAVTVGKRWGTDVYGVAFAQADPTTPTLFLDAGDLPLGVTDDGLYTSVHYSYVDSVDVDGEPDGWGYGTEVDAVATAYYKTRVYEMDLTPLGQITAPTAAAYAAEQLALLTVPQWLNSIDTDSDHLFTRGGQGAYLPAVTAGMMVHLFNVPQILGGLRSELGLNVVLGEVKYDTANPTRINIAPVNLAVRNLADALAQAKSAADAAKKAA